MAKRTPITLVMLFALLAVAAAQTQYRISYRYLNDQCNSTLPVRYAFDTDPCTPSNDCSAVYSDTDFYYQNVVCKNDTDWALLNDTTSYAAYFTYADPDCQSNPVSGDIFALNMCFPHSNGEDSFIITCEQGRIYYTGSTDCSGEGVPENDFADQTCQSGNYRNICINTPTNPPTPASTPVPTNAPTTGASTGGPTPTEEPVTSGSASALVGSTALVLLFALLAM